MSVIVFYAHAVGGELTIALASSHGITYWWPCQGPGCIHLPVHLGLQNMVKAIWQQVMEAELRQKGLRCCVPSLSPRSFVLIVPLGTIPCLGWSALWRWCWCGEEWVQDMAMAAPSMWLLLYCVTHITGKVIKMERLLCMCKSCVWNTNSVAISWGFSFFVVVA